ncbi:MAG TPA: hypothetical protein VJC39_02390 [Candidatus Nanoarchaeia archaeon]|nr:hypothetical protein [Candidatus Nanoarchaeia archaeon]
MKNAYNTSGKIFEQVSKLHNPGLLDQIRDSNPRDIVVVKGTYDHVEKLLDTIKVPYTLIDSSQIASYNGGRVMLVNCKSYGGIGANFDDDNKDFSKQLKEGVKGFVTEGGRLVTTDWALSLVQKTFPGKVSYKSSTGDEVVEVQAHTDTARRFLGLNYAQCHPKWWLEGSSYLFDIGPGVVPIITSQEMMDKHGLPYVAVGFTEGKGEVFHFISHMELQRTKMSTKEDKGSLDDFLKKMKVSKTADMEDAKVAELEAAYSSLNTLAHLCSRTPILSSSMKSIYVGSSKGATGAAKSKGLI